MLQKIKITTKRIGWDYISECEVLDTDTNKKYYVVSQLGNLLYATFESSWMMYRKGNVKDEPVKVEGEDYLYFDCDENGNRSRFYEFYVETMDEAGKLEHKQYIDRKYRNMKKPIGNIKYEIVYKKGKAVHGCGPMGEVYEIKFHILDDDSYLYVYADDIYGAFTVTDISLIDNEEDGEEVYPIELIESFNQAKKSKYYDLYLEMEKYKDDFYE